MPDKNTINNNQGNLAPPELGYPMTERPEYSNTFEWQENDLKTNFVKIIEVLKAEMKKSLKIERKINKNWRSSINSLKNSEKAKKNKQVKENVQELKIKIETIN